MNWKEVLGLEIEDVKIRSIHRWLLGTSEDIEVVEKVVEEKQKESGLNGEEDSLSVVFQ